MCVSCSNLLELLDLCLVKHGKDVRSGSLATLLGMLLPGCSGSTLDGGREEGRRKEGERDREKGREGERDREKGRGGGGGLPQPTQIPKRIHTQGYTQGPHCIIYQQLLDY